MGMLRGWSRDHLLSAGGGCAGKPCWVPSRLLPRRREVKAGTGWGFLLCAAGLEGSGTPVLLLSARQLAGVRVLASRGCDSQLTGVAEGAGREMGCRAVGCRDRACPLAPRGALRGGGPGVLGPCSGEGGTVRLPLPRRGESRGRCGAVLLAVPVPGRSRGRGELRPRRLVPNKAERGAQRCPALSSGPAPGRGQSGLARGRAPVVRPAVRRRSCCASIGWERPASANRRGGLPEAPLRVSG